MAAIAQRISDVVLESDEELGLELRDVRAWDVEIRYGGHVDKSMYVRASGMVMMSKKERSSSILYFYVFMIAGINIAHPCYERISEGKVSESRS